MRIVIFYMIVQNSNKVLGGILSVKKVVWYCEKKIKK